MYSTTDFRTGLKIEVEGIPYEIVDFQHFKPGKGGAMVRTKLRNILTGRIQDITFRSGEKVGKPDMETRDMQFLYRPTNSSRSPPPPPAARKASSRTVRNAACCCTRAIPWISTSR